MRLNMLAMAIGHVYQSADVYASFGVNSAVMSSSDPAEHAQNMLALDVATRDGDTSIDLVEPSEELEETTEEEESSDGDEPEASEGDEEEEGDFKPLGDPDTELTEASQQLEDYSTGFDEMRAQAIKAGLPTDVAARIEDEYEADGKLSDDSYAQLAKAGYSAGFVNSFMQGQEAVAEAYVTKIVAYAGGKEQFDRVVAHLKANSPKSMDSLYDAIERRDLNTVQTVINLGMASQAKKFGKQPERTLNRRSAAPAGRTTAPQVEGYTSQNEMVKAMNDPRYGRDAKYTDEVRNKVYKASW
ncbi:capsid assembly protein [Pseudomonas sp. PSPC3-3]|uniref:capsid assembly protein n=1 Tax=unclassified Pseudomonas TaxID=196821 RepID=UPI003CF94ACF